MNPIERSETYCCSGVLSSFHCGCPPFSLEVPGENTNNEWLKPVDDEL